MDGERSPSARRRFVDRARDRYHVRSRLYAALFAGFAAALLIPGPPLMMRVVIGWDVVALIYLPLLLHMAANATQASMRYRAGLEDPSRWVFLALVAGAGLFSMFAILGLMREAKAAGGSSSLWLSLLAASTVLLSWLFAHSVFAVHYAHDYFNDLTGKRERGLDFPGERDDPDYWDFLYFSFVIGMTAQVSDVQVIAKSWRRLVLLHGILAFLFNTVVLALSINLLAGFFS